MIESRSAALLWAAIIVIFLVSQRRRVFSATCIGVFVMTHVVFVVFGLLALPFAMHEVDHWFSVFDVLRLSDEDLSLAIFLAGGGVILVYFIHLVTQGILRNGRWPRRTTGLLWPRSECTTGYSANGLMLFSGAALAFALAYFALNLNAFIQGIRDGILANRPDLVIGARRASTSNYLYVVIVYNVLPFCSIGLWLYSRSGLKRGLRTYSTVYAGITALLLVLVFQKRPLLIYFVVLFIAHYWMVGSDQFRFGTRARAFLARIRNGFRLIGAGVVLFGVLLALYYSHTQLGRTSASLWEAVAGLSLVAGLRVVGRLSLPSAMYAHFFPQVHPHYGVENIGLLARIFGHDLYLDTREVYAYFTGRDEGSVAVPALFDFYGAFGIAGWILGAISLGILLAVVDYSLKRLKKTVANAHFTIFMLVSVFYLSQASVARSFMGYGAIFFVIGWLIVARRPNPRSYTYPSRGDVPAGLVSRAAP